MQVEQALTPVVDLKQMVVRLANAHANDYANRPASIPRVWRGRRLRIALFD